MTKFRTCSLVYLSASHRQMLVLVSSCSSLRPATRRRARAILLADRNQYPQTTVSYVSDELGISRATVVAIRKRYATDGILHALTPWANEAERIKNLGLYVPSAEFGNMTGARTSMMGTGESRHSELCLERGL